jgi:hypothetical protein
LGIDFHGDVQEPVNNRVSLARNPSIFLGFNLFAPFPWPFPSPVRIDGGANDCWRSTSPFVRDSGKTVCRPTSIKWSNPH